MRMDASGGVSAAQLLNGLSRDRLIKILREYGEEPKAPRMADAIIAARPLATTSDLAKVALYVYKGKYIGKKKMHPATRAFQAVRIAVNDELGQLATTLELLPDLLKPGGHSHSFSIGVSAASSPTSSRVQKIPRPVLFVRSPNQTEVFRLGKQLPLLIILATDSCGHPYGLMAK
jgi:hypothetical protein